MQKAELDAALQAVRTSNAALAQALGENAEALVQNGVKFWALDLNVEASQADFATNVTVTRQALPNAVSFDTFIAINLKQLETLSSRNSEIVHERTSIAGQPAERVRYLLTLDRAQATPMTVAITQYLVLNGRNAFVLTFATRTDLIDKYRSVFDQSAASMRFIGQ